MVTGKTKDWTGKTGGGKFGQKALLLMFRFNPLILGYAILALVVPFYMLFAHKGYSSIYRYFRKQYKYSRFRSFYKTYQNHFVFGQCILDRFAIYAGRRGFFKLETIGNEEFFRLLDEEKGFVVASSHVGNFELSGYLLHQDKKRMHAMVFGGEAEEALNNKARMLSKNNVDIVPASSDLSHIFILNTALQNGEIVSMPCDRNFGSTKSVECEFLNGKADFPQGAFALATMFDVPVLSVFVMKKGFLKYRAYVKRLQIEGIEQLNKHEKIDRLTKSFALELENIVKQYPEQWFNFYNFWK